MIHRKYLMQNNTVYLMHVWLCIFVVPEDLDEAVVKHWFTAVVTSVSFAFVRIRH